MNGVFTITGLDQATATDNIETGMYDLAGFYQFTIQPSATPAAGVLQVWIYQTGADKYGFDPFMLSTTIDLVNGPLYGSFVGVAEKIEFTLVGFDADKTVDIMVTAGRIK